MPKTVESTIDVHGASGTATWNAAGSIYIVQAANGSYYIIYVDTLGDIVYRKSSDGITWAPPVLAFTAGTATSLTVWYDRWTDPSGTLGDLIHIAYTDSGNDDTHYRTINTASSDALSTQTVIFAGTSTGGNGHMSIARAVGGNVYCKTNIDGTAEGGFFRLPNANVPNGAWDAARTIDETLAVADRMHLCPDFDAADNQDMMAIFYDGSAGELSRKLYDDSANSWSETSIATGFTNLVTTTAFPNLAIATDQANTRVILVCWSAPDLANADLRCWIVDAGAITEVTNVVLNSTDDQGLCAIAIDDVTGDWTVFYGGISSGGETWNTAVNVYKKVSQDDGTTWGPETKVNVSAAFTLRTLFTTPRFTGGGAPKVAWVNDATQADVLLVASEIALPKANYLLGV